jgi:DNA-binding transcriptional MerR regulator
MQDDMRELTIKEASQRLGVTCHTLRFWEKELDGVIVPIRTKGNQRRYTSDHLSILVDIKSLKEKGLSLIDIKRIFNHRNEDVPAVSATHGIHDLANQLAEIVRAAVYNILSDRTYDHRTEKSAYDESE